MSTSLNSVSHPYCHRCGKPTTGHYFNGEPTCAWCLGELPTYQSPQPTVATPTPAMTPEIEAALDALDHQCEFGTQHHLATLRTHIYALTAKAERAGILLNPHSGFDLLDERDALKEQVAELTRSRRELWEAAEAQLDYGASPELEDAVERMREEVSP